MNINIERATADDADSLIVVHNKAYLKDFQKYGKFPGYGKTHEKMLMAIENRIIFKIIADDKIIGDIIVVSQDVGHYYLTGLCVIPEYENNGIGQQAMRFLDIYFRDAVHWTLKTLADKVRNQYLYKKCGFCITKECIQGDVKFVVLERDIPCTAI